MTINDGFCCVHSSFIQTPRVRDLLKHPWNEGFIQLDSSLIVCVALQLNHRSPWRNPYFPLDLKFHQWFHLQKYSTTKKILENNRSSVVNASFHNKVLQFRVFCIKIESGRSSYPLINFQLSASFSSTSRFIDSNRVVQVFGTVFPLSIADWLKCES